MQLTGGGGVHYLFEYPEERISSSGKLGPGLDIKSDGGYIVVEPSIHLSGKAYAWEGSSDPLDGVAIMPAPSAIVDRLKVNGADLGATSRSDTQLSREKVVEIRSALAVLPADDYERWVRVGMALHATRAGDQAFGLWDEWSQRCPEKYDPSSMAQTWRSFGKRSDRKPITLFSLFKEAYAHGWVEPDQGLRHKAQQGQEDHDAEPPLPDFLPASSWEGVALRPREWVWDGWLPMGTVIGLGGPPGAAKTLLAQQIATHCSVGKDLFGSKMRKAPAVLLTVEEDTDELHRRQAAINRAMGIQFPDLSLLMPVSLVGANTALVSVDRDGNVRRTPLFETLKTRLIGIGCRLLVLDLAVDFWTGNEIVRQQVNAYVKHHLAELARQVQCAVVVLYHPSVRGMADGSGSSGSTAWEGSFRARLHLGAESESDKALNARTLKRMKANYSGPGDSIRLIWRDGYLHQDTPSAAMEGREQRCKSIVLECIEIAMKQGRNLTMNRRGNYAPAAVHEMQRGMRRPERYSLEDMVDATNALFEEGRLVTRVSKKQHAALVEIAPGDPAHPEAKARRNKTPSGETE